MFGDADAGPTARALITLELLQDRPGIGAAALADRLGVTERAARRYVSILREAGIPVESIRGRYGGYRVGRGMRLAPLMFTNPEALALVMAVLDGHHDASDVSSPVGSAFDKIVRALPAAMAAQVQAIRTTAAPAPDRSAARPDPDTTVTLVTACAQRRRVRIDYRTEAGSQWEATVDPWAVVVRHGRWYLLCFSHAAQDRRSYRIDRIGQVTALDERADVPDDLDPVPDLERQLGVGWEFAVRVEVEAPAADLERYLPATLGRITPTGENTCDLVGSTSNPRWYAERLAALPAPFRVTGGPEVRRAVAELGRRLLAASEDSACEDPACEDPARDDSACEDPVPVPAVGA